MNPQVERERWKMYGVSAAVSLFFTGGVFILWSIVWFFFGLSQTSNPFLTLFLVPVASWIVIFAIMAIRINKRIREVIDSKSRPM